MKFLSLNDKFIKIMKCLLKYEKTTLFKRLSSLVLKVFSSKEIWLEDRS